jgi:TetR/AcrR family acrAB operon transcriptional repressor
MVRKKKDDAQLTCTALLDAAEQVFFENGVAKTTLNDIAAAAGLTRGAIYWHFTDKADLLQAMFTRAMFPMESMLNELLQAANANPLVTLRNMCVQVLTNLAHSPEQQRVFNIMFHRCEHIGPMIPVLENKRAKREECLAQVETALARAVAAGHLPPDTDVVLANQVISNFMAGTMSEWLFAPQSFDLATCAPGMVDMLIAGLQANPPRTAKPESAERARCAG